MKYPFNKYALKTEITRNQISQWISMPTISIAAGELRFNWNGAEWEKTIASGEGSQYLSSRRVRSWLDTLWNPGEDRLEAQHVEWVEVRTERVY